MAGFDSQRWSLKGMTALVTGGTKGIGYAIVEELAGLGATVHTCARNQAQILERLQEWESKGFKVTGSVCDLTSKAQRENLIKTVNSAATCTLRGTTDYTLEDFSSMMKTNVESPYHLSQLAHPLLKASGNASIVFVASIAGVVALPKLSAYAATKSAVIQISKNLACEWAKDNIRTNAVAPWAVNTGVKVESDGHSDDFRRLIGRTPIQRLAQPNEISSLITFLCLPAASYINGQVISVDGGFTFKQNIPMAGFNSQRWSLKGMTALVTGGTKGIGYAIVEELAGLGATVHTCARNEAQIVERLQEWEDKGFKVTGSVCDLTCKAQRENLIKTVSCIFNGKLNILVSLFIALTFLFLYVLCVKISELGQWCTIDHINIVPA
ncbi:hypothetical protein DVH24_026710 [Malus domestica]|uniref:Tropinone reductase I n=1 Tax=Malus domestica TaxID=3750 RepID=A0A498K1Y6_MALDO|nr:hypothetical protein DVH24_026710 [Malus domestica]